MIVKRQLNQSGQIVVIALLAMVVVLAIALVIVGRSMMEIATSTKTEESSRAFSAAEAGIEKALQDPSFISNGGGNLLSFGNNAQASVDINANLPDSGLPLEHPPIGKESFAQFWLADPYSDTLSGGYQQSKFNVYFGAVKDANGQTIDYLADPENQPAIEVMVVYFDGSSYKSIRYLYDSYGSLATETNNDRRANGFGSCALGRNLSVETNRINHFTVFYCGVTVPSSGTDLPAGTKIMVRARVLYSSLSHPIAVGPVDRNFSIPKQATISKSTGTVGNVQRSIEVFKQQSVMPQFLDYALFSASTLQRQQ